MALDGKLSGTGVGLMWVSVIPIAGAPYHAGEDGDEGSVPVHPAAHVLGLVRSAGTGRHRASTHGEDCVLGLPLDEAPHSSLFQLPLYGH